MNNQDYMKNARITAPVDDSLITSRLGKENTIRLLHASIGIQTEGGEIADALKRYIFYGKPVDKINLVEEAGDLLWYISVLLDAVGSDFDIAMELNIAKLRARFGDKFTEAQALTRNLDKERSALEGIK